MLTLMASWLKNQWINDFYVGEDGLWDQSKELHVMEVDSLGTRFMNQKTLEYDVNI